jgi:protein-tyrosine-phosphatase
VVFVCQHGASKSVIAAAHFNQLAERQGLPYRAVSRGLQPDSQIPDTVKAGLLTDGLNVGGWSPKRLEDDDLKHAIRVVTLNCQIRTKALAGRKTIQWTDLPDVSDGYASFRAAITERIDELLRTLVGTSQHH